MDWVSFISTEAGDDLILSFAVQDPDDPTEIQSLIFLRTPKFEYLFEDHEQGVHASFERYDIDEDDYLEEVRFGEQERTVQFKTREHTYELDLRGVHRNEIDAMRKLLRKMNYDRRVKLFGV